MERLKNTVTGCRNGIWGDEPDGVNDIACVRVADFDRIRRFARLQVPTMRSVPASKRVNRLLRAGDLLIEKSGGGELQPVGAVVQYEDQEPAICSNFVARMPVAPGFLPRFLVYLHAALYGLRVTERSIKQTTGIQNLDSDAYLSEKVALPPREEQRAIADFLDRKTGAIDAVIANLERATALLVEARTRTITDAVTSGLCPASAWRDSADDILGRIPSHWGSQRVATIAEKLCNGFVGPTRDILVEEGVPYLQSLHIKSGKVRFDKPYYVTEEWLKHHERVRLRRGDVVIVQTGDIGQVAIIPPDWDGSSCHALIIFRPRRSVGHGEFFSWFFQSHVGRELLVREQTGALHPHLEVGKVREIRLPLPPLDEQADIVRELNKSDERFQHRKALLDRQVGLLREYRQALVAAAVTGQIDVAARVQEVA